MSNYVYKISYYIQIEMMRNEDDRVIGIVFVVK